MDIRSRIGCYLDSQSDKVSRLGRFALRWRWPMMFLLALGVLVSEVDEHGHNGYLEYHFIREILLYGLILPILGGVTLNVLGRTKSERSRAIDYLDRQHTLSQQMNQAQSWEALVRVIVEFPGTVVPLKGAFLFVYNEVHAGFELVDEWQHPEQTAKLEIVPLLDLDDCPAIVSSHSIGLHPLDPQASGLDQASVRRWASDGADGYCLPLTHRQVLIGLLHLYPGAGTVLSSDQTYVLNGVAPAMAVALDNARPNRLANIVSAEAQLERRQIARRLHDTLAQHLAFLCLKLDQLTGDDTLREIAAVQQEMERMREIANEAYGQIRETLTALNPANSTDLAAMLLAHAETMGQATNFSVQFTTKGQPRFLRSYVRRQIGYIFREALINVGKHAQAKQVGLSIIWTDDLLKITLLDDGRGFDVEKAGINGRYGLTIMQERALEANGRLTLVSRPNAGTQVALWLPLNSEPVLT
jgi:signal transduction histidine kinase